MYDFLLGCVVSLIFGFLLARASASGALEAPPRVASAHRCRVAALCYFMTFAALLLAAALVDTLAHSRHWSDVLGFSGLGCLLFCVLCLLKYARVNTKKRLDDWTEL